MARPSWQTGIRAHSQEGWELQLKAEIDFFPSIVFLNPLAVDHVTRRVTVLFCST